MVASATYLADTVFFIKNFLSSNITDPLGSRPANQSFVMTSYPSRATRYPIITVKDLNTISSPLGLQDEAQLLVIDVEIRVWGRTVSERDKLSQEILHDLRNAQIGASGTFQANDLHDFRLMSSVNIDETDGPKSKIMTIKLIFVAI